jgi:multidrug resistance efflux pump
MTMPMSREQQRSTLQINVARAKLASDKKKAAEAVEVLSGYDGSLVEDIQSIRDRLDNIEGELP